VTDHQNRCQFDSVEFVPIPERSTIKSANGVKYINIDLRPVYGK